MLVRVKIASTLTLTGNVTLQIRTLPTSTCPNVDAQVWKRKNVHTCSANTPKNILHIKYMEGAKMKHESYLFHNGDSVESQTCCDFLLQAF